jgi:methylenetetrahydrofolate--tRNA-(uracil-5-)-methyltransferase
MLLGREPVDVPADTALGAVVAHLQNVASPDFQPANVTWTWFSPLDGPPVRDKRARRSALAARALARIDRFAVDVAPHEIVGT